MPTNTPDIVAPLAGRTSLYRLLVRAVDDPRRKGYVWEILPVDNGRRIGRAVVNRVQIDG